MFFVIALAVLIAALIGLYVKGSFTYWDKKGVPYVEGSFPWGSQPNMLFSTVYQGDHIEYFYNKLAPHPFGGFYQFTIPYLLVRDPEVVKLVLVKDFSHFQSRTTLKSLSTNIVAKNLFNLESDLWKSLRVKLTPTFTSGKLKNMSHIFEDCSGQLVTHLYNLAASGSDDGIVLSVKDTIARFTTDIIVSAAFGLESNCINNPDNNPFREIGQLLSSGEKTTIRSIFNALFEYAPNARRFMKSNNISRVEEFMTESIRSTIEYREKNQVKRNDFLNLLIDLKNKHGEDTIKRMDPDVPDIEMDLNTIVAQCFVFFAAGFETSSSVQTFSLYHLALHQDVQDKLRKEMQEVVKRHGGKPTYQALLEMAYLGQVINETMRIYPTLPMTFRVCTKDYQIPGTDTVIERGTKVIIPIYALHHDSKYYPDPDKFNPDRFSKENESSLTPYTFLPFGEGPRNCIGMRFGLLQTRFGLYSIITNFRVLTCKETEIPPIMRGSNLVTLPRKPIKLKFQKL